MTEEHVGRTVPIDSERREWFGACSCGHTGPERERISQAAADLSLHFRDVARAAQEASE